MTTAQLQARILVLEGALRKYADEKNWGNGGWEGHPNDFFTNSENPRAWQIAQEALKQKDGP